MRSLGRIHQSSSGGSSRSAPGMYPVEYSTARGLPPGNIPPENAGAGEYSTGNIPRGLPPRHDRVGGTATRAGARDRGAASVPRPHPHAAASCFRMSADDAVYATAMLMFATLPILSMRKPKLQHLPPDASSCTSLEPARLVAAAAFILLLWLQVRKEYLLGVAMIAINLALRLYELARRTSLSHVQPEPQSGHAAAAAPTSFRRSVVPEVRWAALSGGLRTARAPGAFVRRTVAPQATTTSVRSSGGGRRSCGRPGGRAAGRRSSFSASSASPAPAPRPSRAASSGEPRRRSGTVCKASRRSCLRPCFTLPCC